ncbi:signal peptidase complex catalytic subunit SEC11 [Striga asiatica]|uniref:Signal peptidase complex catalytic subunit SEC11 n=1 Tax=Striga asiatica TaxID=4170 RepID=A0A5A7PD56_STRAF|nr:signal peptidase complex catalytic subunit SEC11 [Striga asiatica]
MVAEIGNYGSLVDGVQERERKRKQAEVEVRRELEDRERRERERDDGEKHEMGCDRDWELNFCREGDPAERRTGDRERYAWTFAAFIFYVTPIVVVGLRKGMIISSALIIWKTLVCITGSESLVVVLFESMESGFARWIVENPLL